jgi:hypothetical protein
MRLLTVVPHLSILTRPIAPLAAIALLLGGCSALGGNSAATAYTPSSTLSMSLVPPNSSPSIYYLRDGVPRSVRRDFVSRYACASGAPLACTCMSRLSEACDCRCDGGVR